MKLDSKEILIIIGSFILGLGMLFNGHHWGGDFAQYIMQARAIISGDYQEMLDLLASGGFDFTYPWGYPMILATTIVVLGENIMVFKILNLLLLSIANTTFYLVFRKYIRDQQQWVILALLSFNAYMLFYANNILSDIPFYAFSTISLSVIHQLMAGVKYQQWYLAIFLAFTIAMAILIRTNGYFLIAILLVVATLHVVRFKFIATTLLSTIVFILIPSLLFPVQKDSIISTILTANLESIVNNIIYYSLLLADVFYLETIYQLSFIKYFVYAFLLLPLLTLKASDLYKFKDLFGYVVFTFGLYVVWPPQQGLRFLFPMLPILLFLFSYCLNKLSKLHAMLSTLFRLSVVTFTIVLSLSLTSFVQLLKLNGEVKLGSTSIAYESVRGPYSNASKEMFSALSSFMTKDQKAFFFAPRVLQMRSGYQATSNPKDSEIDIVIVDKNPKTNKLDLIYPDFIETPYYKNEKYSTYPKK